MKLIRRIPLCALLIVFLCTMIAPAAAATEMPNLNRTGSISLSVQYEGEAVPGGSILLYRVADVTVNNGFSFAFTSDFAPCGYALEHPESNELAEDLADFALQNHIPCQRLGIDENGTVSTEQDLPVGLYLIVQDDPAPGFDPMNSFLVSIPMHEGEHLVYDVNASPKMQVDKITDIPDDDPPRDPKPPHLPQTGQLWWPVAPLAISGLLCFAYGWKKRRDGENQYG